MAGARHDIAVRIAKPLGRAPDGADTAIVEFDWVELAGLLDLHLEANFPADLGCASAKLGFHIVNYLLFRVAEIDGEYDLAWNDVARIWINVTMANSADGKWSVRPSDFVDKLRDPSHAETCIDPLRHRGRSGMCFLAGKRYLKPVQPLPVSNDADIDILIL